MALASGTRLGPYEILSPLGAGGMGEVYRARDTRLAREVAIKVLPTALASDPERLKRFEKEARSASALNHPNIITVYDIGAENGVSFIAMELVSGTSLRQVMLGGALPVRKLLQVAQQIAEGLAKAHEAGIVHRDLKPENVMVNRDGLVKILDFGLAKLTTSTSGSGESSHQPTMTGTSPGVIVGTAGYMSPEQASGEPLDARSDQFAFGSILYEMATGKRAFLRKTGIDTLAAVLNDEPESVGSVNPQTPTPLRWVVERCLAKDPEGRYESTKDLARDLASLRDHISDRGLSGGIAAGKEMRRRPPVPALVAVAAAVALVAAGILAQRWLTSRAPATVPSFHKLTFRRGNVLNARLSPDGKTAVYSAAWDGAPSETFTINTDSKVSRSIGLTNAIVHSVSSKGELAVVLTKAGVVVWAPGTLARIPIGGGTPRELLENVISADWAPNGEDLAVVRGSPTGKNRLEYPIGNVLVQADGLGPVAHVSPDGDLVLFSAGDDIATIDRKGKKTVVSKKPGAGDAFWSARGDEIIIVDARSGDDPAVCAVSLSGRERVLFPFGRFNLMDVGRDGRLLVELNTGRDGMVFGVRGQGGERELGWLDSSFPADISADGGRILFNDASDPDGTYIRKTDGSPAARLGNGRGIELSADGRWALALKRGELDMLPTGPGTDRRIPIEGFEPQDAGLLRDGSGFMVYGWGKDGAFLSGVVGPDGGKPRWIRFEGVDVGKGGVLSPTGDRGIYATVDRHLKIVSLAGGELATVPGDVLEPFDSIVQWSADGRFVYLTTHGGWGIPERVDRVELATGKRERWMELLPTDPVGVWGISSVRMTRDGEAYAYSYQRVLASDLYIVDRVH